MLQSSKDRASWEIFDLVGLFRLSRIRCTKAPRIAPAVVEFLGNGARSATLLNEQARRQFMSCAGLTRAFMMTGNNQIRSNQYCHAGGTASWMAGSSPATTNESSYPIILACKA
jgi:hypothetical protein